MKNPWLKKNPFLSMWISAANRASVTARAVIRCRLAVLTAAVRHWPA
jgi:hypothetical protein